MLWLSILKDKQGRKRKYRSMANKKLEEEEKKKR